MVSTQDIVVERVSSRFKGTGNSKWWLELGTEDRKYLLTFVGSEDLLVFASMENLPQELSGDGYQAFLRRFREVFFGEREEPNAVKRLFGGKMRKADRTSLGGALSYEKFVGEPYAASGKTLNCEAGLGIAGTIASMFKESDDCFCLRTQYSVIPLSDAAGEFGYVAIPSTSPALPVLAIHRPSGLLKGDTAEALRKIVVSLGKYGSLLIDAVEEMIPDTPAIAMPAAARY